MKTFLIGLIVAVSLGAQASDMSEVRGSKWITVAPDAPKNAAVAQFVKDISLAAPIQKATLYASGLGVYEVRINGLRPGDENEILRPGFTTWFKTRQVEKFDVTDAAKIGKGQLTLSATVANSWWGDDCARAKDGVPGFRCVLEIVYEGGETARVVTDETWLAGWEGPYKVASIFEGEDYDARSARGWEKNITHRAVEYKGGVGAALPKMGRGTWRRKDLTFYPCAAYAWDVNDVRGANENQFGEVVKRPIDLKANGPIVVVPGEEVVIDFGQNAAFHPVFVAQAERAGAKLTINCAEMLNDGKGEKARRCDGPGGSRFKCNYARARSEINYTFATTGSEMYQPTFTFFGYRYLHLRADAKVTITKICSVPVTSVLGEWERGKIVTGNGDINRLIKNCEWGMYSNYLSVPTDCPQRSERQGWTGDAQVFIKAAMFTADVTPFMCKWMRDMRDMQNAEGAYGVTAPHGGLDACVTLHEGATRSGWLGWADAGIIVPYQVWKLGGDTKILSQNWDSMTRYLNFLRKKAETFPLDVTWECADWVSFEKLETCKAYSAVGFHWKGSPEHRKWWSFLNDAYYLWDTQMMAEMAAVLGKEKEAEAYRQEATKILPRMRERYLDADGRLYAGIRDMQCANLFALKTGIFTTEERRKEACENLRGSFAAHGGCLQTGFLGTSILMDTLVESGEAKMAYDLLFNRKCPSWLAAVDCGATTLWEAWNSYSKEEGFRDGMLSFNHYAYGAVLGWLYEKAAGIAAPKDGTLADKVILAPHPDRRLGSIAAEVRTPHGLVKSAWRYEKDGKWAWTFSIPRGMTAEVLAPGEATSKPYGAGNYTLSK